MRKALIILCCKCLLAAHNLDHPSIDRQLPSTLPFALSCLRPFNLACLDYIVVY